jgi:Bifunctional DNA primase/polymerase, N-terminal
MTPNTLRMEALRLAQILGWAVARGTYLADGACSCGELRCPAPGRHPAAEDGSTRATGDRARIEAWWGEHPQASIVLPTGIHFDVLDVPAGPGHDVLTAVQRFPDNLGPVAGTATGRVQFFVQAGARKAMSQIWQQYEAERDQGLDWQLWLHGRGDQVLAPPSGLEGPHAVTWLVSPFCKEVGVRELPSAVTLLPLIAAACHGYATATARPA